MLWLTSVSEALKPWRENRQEAISSRFFDCYSKIRECTVRVVACIPPDTIECRARVATRYAGWDANCQRCNESRLFSSSKVKFLRLIPGSRAVIARAHRVAA